LSYIYIYIYIYIYDISHIRVKLKPDGHVCYEKTGTVSVLILEVAEFLLRRVGVSKTSQQVLCQ
jgi:hypothetical protein